MNATSVSHNHPPTATPDDHFFRDAQVDCRDWSTDQLLAALEVVNLDLEDLNPLWPGDVGRYIASERKRAYENELDRRVRIFSLPNSQAKQYSQDRDQWTRLAREVRQRVEVPEVLHLIGYPTTKRGNEYHGPCPACRDGVDRLVSRGGPDGRVWCRKCGWKGDAIAIVQSFVPDCSHFRDAVTFLADLAGMTTETAR